jgi:hypothetical protein
VAKQKRVRLKLSRPDRARVRKCSFLLSEATDIRISVLAASRRMDRSGLVERLLSEATAGVVVEIPDVATG